MIKRILALIIVFLLIQTKQEATAQIKQFSTDSVEFIRELGGFFMTERKKEGEAFVIAFRAEFNSPKFDEKLKQNVYATCSAMLKKRLRAYPDFEAYLTTIVSFVNGKYSRESFDAWQQSLDKVLKTMSTSKFQNFLEASSSLFAENLIYKSSTVEWSSSSNNFTFNFDSVPYVTFPSLDLKCYAKGDSMVIYGTSGVFYPLDYRWEGKKGTVYWTRAGMDKDKVYAELNNYNISVKTSSYKADSVTFYNKEYFENRKLFGYFEDKLLANVTEDKASYPRFESYNKRLEIKNIIDGVDYDGGFAMNGARFLGTGSKEEKAMLTFYRKDNVFLVVYSRTFVVKKDRINSERATIVLYLENDSIYHPGLNFKVLSKEREVTLYRDGKGIALSPFYNTYHQLDMDVEAIYWKMDEPMIQMQNVKGNSQVSAYFESANYYSEKRYLNLMGMDAIHPLVAIRETSKKVGSDIIYAADVSSHIKIGIDQVNLMLINLSNQGFIAYEIDEQKVIIKDKLYHYLLSNAKKSDYDMIDIKSESPNAPNATLSLLDYSLTFRGVPVIYLSDSQKVMVRPYDKSIVMRKNRDFSFNGVVNAGLFDLHGKNFDFHYNDFKIDLNNVDSLVIRVAVGEPDESGFIPVRRVKTVLEGIKGDLLIDDPGNKAGLKDKPQYPIINSRKDAFVYYDRSTILNNVYKRDKFYFKVYPFTFDSLDNFVPQTMEFDGMFASAGIFPDFEEKLKLQPDYSLGFVRKTPPGGYKTYGGKATFENDINLSHNGLRGDGTFKYLNSVTYSKDFIFFPDSMNTVCSLTLMEELKSPIEYPQVDGEGAYIHFEPYKDFMRVDKRDKALNMFKGQAESHGSLFLTPKGLEGKGLMTFAKAEMESNLYKYKANEMFADTADFRLAALENADIAFKTNNVNAHIDFTNRKGLFKTNGQGSFVEFPINQYICFMDQFTWFMDQDDIEMSSSETANKITDPTNSGLDLSGSQFISTHAKQDSLTFFAPKAKYSLKDNIIYAKGVKFLNVADAMLYPENGDVTVEKRAYMRPFSNAKITANFVTQHHHFYNASVNVQGKKSYNGSAYYDYIDENDTKQPIYFYNLATDTTAQTYAKGTISDTSNFKLSPYFEFKGDVELQASIKDLTFEGVTRIVHDCNLTRSWMKFKGAVDPLEIYIPVPDEPRDENNDKMSNSIMYSNDSIPVYTTFISKRNKVTDEAMVASSGFLYYDKGSREYRIASKEKLSERTLPGNYLAFNVGDCKVYGEGKLNFGANFGSLSVKPYGNAIHNLNDNTVVFDVVLLLDFFFEENALEKLADQLEKSTSSEAVKLDRQVYEKALREILGKDDADKAISQLNLQGAFRKFPDELKLPFVFNDVKMKFDQNTKSYRSLGNIGISNIYKKQLNKMVNGKIQITKKRSGDILDIYIELEGGIWYYFNYTRGVMQAVSSNEEFNKVITELKNDKRKLKTEKGQQPYQFMISNVRKKSDFLKKWDSAEEQGGE